MDFWHDLGKLAPEWQSYLRANVEMEKPCPGDNWHGMSIRRLWMLADDVGTLHLDQGGTDVGVLELDGLTAAPRKPFRQTPVMLRLVEPLTSQLLQEHVEVIVNDKLDLCL